MGNIQQQQPMGGMRQQQQPMGGMQQQAPPMGAPQQQQQMGAPPQQQMGAPPQTGAPQQQPPPMGGGVGGFGAPPPVGGGGYQVPQTFVDPEGGAYEGGGAAAGVPPAGGFPNAAGMPPPPTGGRHVGAIQAPPGGMPGAVNAPQPAAPVQFFNPAAVPQRQPKPGVPQAGAPGAADAPAEQMNNMNLRTGPAQAFSLGDLAAGPTDWKREAANPIPDVVGQSQPRYMQVSCGAFPASSALLQKFSLPIAVNIQPLNDPETAEGFSPVPVVNFGNCGVIRCRRCRTYMNPFVSWLDAGRRWRCNGCGLLNDVPPDYYCSLDQSGKRKDHAERPELNYGSVEYVAPADYMVRPPQPPAFVFVIDVSARAVQSGMVQEVCATVLANLDKMPGGQRTQVGFVTFDSSYHFYNLKSSLSEAQMLCVPDLEDPFLPLPAELLVNLQDSREQVEGLLTKLPDMFANTTNSDSCFFPAVQAGTAMMQSIGGKMLVFQSTPPTLGRPVSRAREDTALLGTDKESSLLIPSSEALKSHALEVCSKNQISVDLFCCCEHYADLASLSPLPKYTGGQLTHYPGFYAARDADTLRFDLTRALTRKMAFEAVMRVRASGGVKVSAFHGNHFLRGADLLALPTCDQDKGFSCELAHEEQNLSCSHILIQAALLYTSSDGERRIRVHNLNLPVTQNMSDLYSLLNVPATMNSLLKTAVEQALLTKMMDARSRLQSACVNALRGHRLMNNAPIPEQSQMLPLYTLAALKSAVMRDGVETRSDERVWLMLNIGSMSTQQVDLYLYPNMMPLHKFQESNGGAEVDGQVVMPVGQKLSAEGLEGHGVYLIDNGMLLLMWIGKQVPSQLLVDLLNVPDAERLDGAKVSLPVLQNDLSIRVNTIVGQLRKERGSAMPLYTIRQGGAAEQKVLGIMAEDRTLSTMSYPEWWTALGRQLA